jgi:hypothetical protein
MQDLTRRSSKATTCSETDSPRGGRTRWDDSAAMGGGHRDYECNSRRVCRSIERNIHEKNVLCKTR